MFACGGSGAAVVTATGTVCGVVHRRAERRCAVAMQASGHEVATRLEENIRAFEVAVEDRRGTGVQVLHAVADVDCNGDGGCKWKLLGAKSVLRA